MGEPRTCNPVVDSTSATGLFYALLVSVGALLASSWINWLGAIVRFSWRGFKCVLNGSDLLDLKICFGRNCLCLHCYVHLLYLGECFVSDVCNYFYALPTES